MAAETINAPVRREGRIAPRFPARFGSMAHLYLRVRSEAPECVLSGASNDASLPAGDAMSAVAVKTER